MAKREILDGPLKAEPKELTDDEKRRVIPKRSDLSTKYHPVNDWLMIVPLASMEMKGMIHIPGVAQREMFEGHIVEMGPDVDATRWGVGDCITWEHNAEFRMDLDRKDKVAIIRPMNILLRIPAADLQ